MIGGDLKSGAVGVKGGRGIWEESGGEEGSGMGGGRCGAWCHCYDLEGEGRRVGWIRGVWKPRNGCSEGAWLSPLSFSGVSKGAHQFAQRANFAVFFFFVGLKIRTVIKLI